MKKKIRFVRLRSGQSLKALGRLTVHKKVFGILLPKIYDQEAGNVFTALSKTMVEFDMFPIGQKMDGASFSE